MKMGRKKSGGKYSKSRKKKKFERAGQRRMTKLGDDEKRKTKKTKGGNIKNFLLRAKKINVLEGKKITKAEIKNVLETPSNRFLARQNIITKGTIVETNLGKVRVTNRPTQDGVLNGILIQKKR